MKKEDYSVGRVIWIRGEGPWKIYPPDLFPGKHAVVAEKDWGHPAYTAIKELAVIKLIKSRRKVRASLPGKKSPDARF